MDSHIALFATAGALLVAGIGGVGWWLQRRRVAELELRLREAEDSRLEISEDAALLRQRLQAADRERAAPPAAPGLAERRVALERLLNETPRPAQGTWEDTQPMTPPPGTLPFAPTQPAPLDAAGDTRR